MGGAISMFDSKIISKPASRMDKRTLFEWLVYFIAQIPNVYFNGVRQDVDRHTINHVVAHRADDVTEPALELIALQMQMA
jgi:hypothetical protein